MSKSVTIDHENKRFILHGEPIVEQPSPQCVAERKARALIGKRIEIPVHYDLWMRGARFGTATGLRRPKTAGESIGVYVKMDHPEVKRRLVIWALDFDYVKVI